MLLVLVPCLMTSGLSLLGQAKSSTATTVESITAKASAIATWKRIDVRETGRAKKLDYFKSAIGGSEASILGTFKGQTFTLQCVDSKEPGRLPQLVFTLDDKKQTIIEIKESWALVWAGDLDGDGKLDLIIHTENDNGVSSKGIYLSSRALSDLLVGYDSSLDVSEGC